MECERCGRWWPPDPETGYDVDGICLECQDEEVDVREAPAQVKDEDAA